MASFNKCVLIGNLTRDPETRTTASSASVCSFGLAVSRKYRQGDETKEETCFVDISVWGKQGEACAKYLKKGSPVLVEGRLSYRQWETSEGQKRNKLEVVALDVQFLGGKNSSQTENQNPQKGEDVPF